MEEDVITLSSDEDNESPESSKLPILKNNEINDCIKLLKEKLQHNLSAILNQNNQTKMKAFLKQGECVTRSTPEVVDLVDCNEKLPENSNFYEAEEIDTIKNHSDTNDADGKVSPTFRSISSKYHLLITKTEMPNDKNSNLEEPVIEVETDCKISNNTIPQTSLELDDIAVVKNNMTENNCNEICQDKKNLTFQKNFNIFKEFVDYCGSLEESLKDREKLIGKLNKSFIEAEPEYIRSKEFRNLITKCKNKTNTNNLYLVAKTISDELKLHKNVRNRLKNEPAKVKEKSVSEGETSDSSISLRQQKRLAKIQKIIKKLNHLGSTIRELEKQEVDLSDEEDSVYLKLQRYRERFWVIYKKLSEYTSDVDINRLFDEKIHFTETKYPAINRCIEKWLNKTRRFPDFADILKIVENQSTESNLPANKDSLRAIAIEIFQKVGDVLQRKRKYDLWNSFSEFLEDTEDPVVNNPELEKIFKENYETRLKKEQEIYQFYAERQEKESLQPKEVSEEDAYCSPESGNEEEEEIISIEKNLGKKLFDDVGFTGPKKKTNDGATPKNANASLKEKESKNNFKNCKSLKWRSGGASKSDSSDDSPADVDISNGEKTTGGDQENGSSPELILVEPDNQKDIDSQTVHRFRIPNNPEPSPKKRSLPFGNENCSGKKKSLGKNDLSNIVDLREDGEDINKTMVFDVGYCQIVTNHNFKEKRKVFRDLTNLNRLMKKSEMRNKMTGLNMPTFLYSRYSFKKETSWKKRFRINLREIKPKNQKCALNEKEKTSEKISSTSSRDSEDKNSKENADGEKEGADFSGQGNGQEEDNNDKGDENRKNGKVEDENDDHEEDDDEEKEDENAEAAEHSSNTEKTEKKNLDSLEPITSENHTLDDTQTLDVENMDANVAEGATSEYTNQQNMEEEKRGEGDGNLENSIDADYESCRDTGNKSKDLEDAEEFENLKNSLEPICVLKEGDASDVIAKASSENLLDMHQNSEENNAWNVTEKLKEEKLKTGPFTRSKLKTKMAERSKSESQNQKRLPVTTGWTPPSEISPPKSRKMSASDEERVKRFLMHSPSSISITPPKKLTLSKPPSQSALQALATLRNLKGISATIVKGKPKREEMTMMGGQSKRSPDQSSPVTVKRRRPDLPVISNVQSINTLTPKIVTVQGNVSGFENLWPEMRNNGNTDSDSSSIKISKVWGSLPETIVPANPLHYPSCSSRKAEPGTSNQIRKKNPKKQVEYVVLD